MSFRRIPGATVISDASTPVTGIIGVPGDSAGSGTEIITPSTISAVLFSVVGYANTFAGALQAITDNSDLTYIDATTVGASVQNCLVNCGFTDLLHSAGRTILHFTVVVRVSVGAGGKSISADTFTGASIDLGPSGLDIGLAVTVNGGGMREVRIGPFYRSGGGNFTVAQINALACRVAWTESTGIRRIGKVSLEVTYA